MSNLDYVPNGALSSYSGRIVENNVYSVCHEGD